MVQERRARVGEDAFETVQEAVDAAPSGETVTIDAGAFFGGVVVVRPVTLAGAGMDVTILDADGAGPVIEVTEEGTLILMDLTVTGGTGHDREDDGLTLGGGLYSSGNVLAERVAFRDNEATTGGGACIWGGSFDGTAVVFEENRAAAGSAIFHDWGSVVLRASRLAVNRTLVSAYTEEYDGAALYSGSDLRLEEGTVIEGNTGAAMWVFRGETRVSDAIIRDNAGTDANGACLSSGDEGSGELRSMSSDWGEGNVGPDIWTQSGGTWDYGEQASFDCTPLGCQ